VVLTLSRGEFTLYDASGRTAGSCVVSVSDWFLGAEGILL